MRKVCILLLTVLLACVGLIGCELTDESGVGGTGTNSISNKKYQFMQEPKMSVEYSDLLDYYSVEISGIFKNTSNRDYSYVSLEFSILDSEGNKLGTAYDNVSELKAGGTWKFKATSHSEEDKPVSFELADVTMW